MTVTQVLRAGCGALLPILFLGCASTESHYQGAGQWVVVSTNAAASRLTGTNAFPTAAAPLSPPLDRQTFRQELEQRGVTGDVLQKVSEGKPFSLVDLEMLARQKVPDEMILRYLGPTDTIYVLTSQDIDQLRAAGISPAVIDYLLATRMRPTIVPRYEYYPTHRPYYYEPFYGYPTYYHHHHYYRPYPRSVIRKR